MLNFEQEYLHFPPDICNRHKYKQLVEFVESKAQSLQVFFSRIMFLFDKKWYHWSVFDDF